MRTLQQLAAANITDTDTTDIGDIQDTFLSKDVQEFAEAMRVFRQAVNENKTLVGTNDKTLRIPVTTSHSVITTAHTEGDERTYTEMSNLDTVDITPALKLGAIAIAKELVKTTRVDLIALAKRMVAEDIEVALEKHITTMIDTGYRTNVVYGGDAADPSLLDAGDKISTDLVADAIELLKEDNAKPYLLFISPAQENVFLKSSQFTNAAEYGSNEVVLNGEIGKYLGVKILVTSLCQGYTSGTNDLTTASDGTTTIGQWGIIGTSCQMIGLGRGRQLPMTLAWNELPHTDYEYLKRYANHYIYYDAGYAAGAVQPKAICLIKVADA